MNLIFHIAKKTWKEKLSKKQSIWLILFLNILLFVITLANYQENTRYNKDVFKLSKSVREKWESNPDKHPHRMAHYGYVAFRSKFPLSFFDLGLDNYLGNSQFLEAHKQNAVNFSESSFSNAIIKFGEISASTILQLLLTLIIFFWGYNIVSKERENGVLKMLIIQGVSWRKIIFGKTIGLFYLSLTIYLPIMLLGLVILFTNDFGYQVYFRYGLIFIFYLLYFLTMSLFTVFVSTLVSSSKFSLTLLLSYWLFFIVILPRVSQVAGQLLLPTPSRAEFNINAATELSKYADSHNPDDPYFKNVKDSILNAYKVSSVEELPINYGGFIMKESEKVSSNIYEKHKLKLVQNYIQQQNFVKWGAIISPYMSIKNISTALTGTNYLEYVNFQNQAEKYRYYLAQELNDLHINYVSNKFKSSADKRSALDNKHWKMIKDFKYNYKTTNQVVKKEILSIIALFVWFVSLCFSVYGLKKSFRVI